MALRLAFSLSLILVAAPACQSHGKGPGASASATASASAAPAPSASAPSRRLPLLRRQGFAGLAFNSAGDLDLSDDQVSTLKKLEDDFEPLDREVRAASEQLQADLNAGIRAGKFDEAKLKADAAAIDKASLTAQAQEVDAIDGLYGALDPDQRSALITALRKREAAFQAGRPPAVPDAGASAAAAKRNQQTLDRMTKDLALDAKQKKEVAALLAKQEGASGSGSADGRDDMLKRLDAFLDAFDRPGFSAKDVDLTDSRPAHTPQSAEIGLLETLVPILTPEQREKLAAARSRPPPIHMRAPLN